MRHYKRKTNRGTAAKDVMDRAAKLVVEGQTCRSVAKDFALCHVTLSRYCKKLKANMAPGVGYARPRQVFNEHQEEQLTSYLGTASKLYFGLSPMELKKLAFKFAVSSGAEIPEAWTRKARAGDDWLSAFLTRYKNLSIRKPEATSLARATSFNRHNVKQFFDNLADVMM